jgi:hypothetical protein
VLKARKETMSHTNIDNITALFTHPHIPRNVEVPHFESIQSIHMLLNQNTTGVLCSAYGNTLGMLGLTLIAASYQTLAGTDFNLPTQPPPSVIPSFASNVQVTEIMRVYENATRIFNKYVARAKSLKNQLLGACDNDYFLSIYNQATQYEESTVLQLLQHLYTNYGYLRYTQLTFNSDKF